MSNPGSTRSATQVVDRVAQRGQGPGRVEARGLLRQHAQALKNAGGSRVAGADCLLRASRPGLLAVMDVRGFTDIVESADLCRGGGNATGIMRSSRPICGNWRIESPAIAWLRDQVAAYFAKEVRQSVPAMSLGIIAGGGVLPGGWPRPRQAAGRAVFIVGPRGLRGPAVLAPSRMNSSGSARRGGSCNCCGRRVARTSCWSARCAGLRCSTCGRMRRVRASWRASAARPSPGMTGCWPPSCGCSARRGSASWARMRC